MTVLSDYDTNESQLSERLKFIRRAENILSQAVKEYSRLTGIGVQEIHKHLSIRRIDHSLNWIEFDFRDSFFHYRKQE